VTSTGADVQALIKRASDRGKTTICWFAKQEPGGLIDQYMTALEAIEAETPGKVNRSEVHRTLNNELGGAINSGTVSRHIRGECHCGRFT
jgi:hypothetical protein